MSAIIPFDFSAPATRGARRPASINAEAIIPSSGFPVISIKGKTFAIIKGDERRVLTRMIDDEEVPVASMSLAVVRANAKSRVFYGKAYVEGDSDGAKPACFSHDGVQPDAQAESPQAKNCQLCPHAQWGSKVSQDGQGGKGTACTPNTRLAVADPKAPDTVYLLRVPAGSRASFSEAVKLADGHGKDYNEVLMKISFDQDAPSPKLVFKPTGLLAEETFAKIQAKYEDSVVMDIVGTPSVRMAEVAHVAQPALEAPKPKALAVVTEDELESVLAAPPAPAPAKKTTAAAAKKTVAPTPAPAPSTSAATADAASLLEGLASILGATDD